jgi:hypothetical protein
MRKLGWFLRDFLYDPELLAHEQVDEKALPGLRGIVKISHTLLNGISLVNLDGFAPASQWEELSATPWLHKARKLPKEDLRREVEKELTGKETEPSELIYFKVYKSQIPVIEQAIETAARMLGTDKSRGYCLEMICADFIAGAHLDNGNSEILLNSISRYYKFLPGEQQQAFLENLREKAS